MKRACWVFITGSFVAVLLLSTGCKTVSETGRRQLNLISSEQELQLGLTSFSQMKTNEAIDTNPQNNALVSTVGKKIAAQASKDLPNAQWEFVVFKSDEANAFCLPGGKVGVYSGILPITQTEAGLATVLGHEVAHAAAHHGSERMSEQMVIQGIGNIGGSAISNPKVQQIALMAYGGGTKVLRELPHSRSQESEADHIGLLFMARAGYDPSEAVAFWQRFSASHGGSTPSKLEAFLSTHPLDAQRIADLKKWLPEAMAEYQRAKGGAASPSTPARTGTPAK